MILVFVIFKTIYSLKNILLQDIPHCLPNASSCYSAMAENSFGCMISCTGIYSDITFAEQQITGPLRKTVPNMISSLAEEGELKINVFTFLYPFSTQLAE